MEKTELSTSRILCDFIVLALLASPLLIFQLFLTPHKRGFFCDDESIRYPYHESTVSRRKLGIFGVLIPIFLIIATELIRYFHWEKNCHFRFVSYQYRKWSVNRLLVRIYVFIGYFLVGACFNQLMVDIAKYTIGRQRPHFIAVCNPTDGNETSQCLNDPHRYITDFTCTGTDQYLLTESQLSFYSGHASFSFYVAWYTTLYLQSRFYRPLFSQLFLPIIQFFLFYAAVFVSYTRISNYKHHWSDVLIGGIVGSAIGIITAVFVARVFDRREIPPEFCRGRYLTIVHKESASEVDQQQNGRDVELGIRRL